MPQAYHRRRAMSRPKWSDWATEVYHKGLLFGRSAEGAVSIPSWSSETTL